MRCCSTGDDSNSAWQGTVGIKTIILENQDLEIVSKTLEGINGQENNNNNKKAK